MLLLLILAYLGGVLTILSPCILAVLPFVFARADRPFAVYLLPSVLDKFRRLYPGITIDLAVSNTEHVETAVLAHERQIGFIEGPYDAVVFDAVAIGYDELIPTLTYEDLLPYLLLPIAGSF